MKTIIHLSSLILIFCFLSCEEPVDVDPSTFEDVSQANNEMGFQMLKVLDSEEPDKNIFISPLSISSAISMTSNGAEGETKQEIYEALHVSGLDEEKLNEQYKNLLLKLVRSDNKLQLSIANAIYHRQELNPKSDFIGQAEDNFQSKVEALDFEDPSAKDEINQWVADQTEDRIKNIISNISSQDVMFLINTIYFKGPWSQPFLENSTHSGTFFPDSNTQEDVDMMLHDSQFRYLDRPDFQASTLLIGKDEPAFAMDIILPKSGKRPADLIPSLSAEFFDSLIRDLQQETRLMVIFPKMEIEYEKEMKETMESLGMVKAFRENAADLSGIVESSNLFISRIKHKTFLKIEEGGLEAAGATSVGVSLTSVPPTLRVDRPFLLMIRDLESSTILFLGKIMNPNE